MSKATYTRARRIVVSPFHPVFPTVTPSEGGDLCPPTSLIRRFSSVAVEFTFILCVNRRKYLQSPCKGGRFVVQ